MTTLTISITDSKVYFSYFHNQTIQTLKPIDIAISTQGNTLIFGQKALYSKNCISTLVNTSTLDEKITKNNELNSKLKDGKGAWCLFMKHIKNHIESNNIKNANYVISLPTFHLPALRNYVEIACKINEMKIMRIITNDIAGAIGYHNEAFWKSNSDNRIVLGINLDDLHTSFTTFYMEKNKIIKLVSNAVDSGQIRMMKTTIYEIEKDGKMRYDTDIDNWVYSERKKIPQVYEIIAEFGTDTKKRQAFFEREEEDENGNNYVPVERNTLNTIFAAMSDLYADLADNLVKKTHALISNPNFQSGPMRGMKVSQFFVYGTHSNPFHVSLISERLNIRNDSREHPDRMIEQGCGWFGSQIGSETSNRNIEIDSVILPNTMEMFEAPDGRKGTSLGKFPQTFFFASQLVRMAQPRREKNGIIEYIQTTSDISGKPVTTVFTVGAYHLRQQTRVNGLFIVPKKFFGCFTPNENNCVDEFWIAPRGVFGRERPAEREGEIEMLQMNVDENKLKEIVMKEQEIIMNHMKVVEFKEKVNKKELPEILKRLKREQAIELRKEWNQIVDQFKENPSQLENAWSKLVFKYQN